MNSGLRTSIALLVLAGATELVVFSNGQGPIRIGLTFLFLMLAPGWSILRLVNLEMSISARIGMAVGISTGLDMAVASALLYARWWSAELALTIIVAVVIIAVMAGLPSARRSLVATARQARSSLRDLGNS
jgi:hypothetical protein